jgi:hypothetical protein
MRIENWHLLFEKTKYIDKFCDELNITFEEFKIKYPRILHYIRSDEFDRDLNNNNITINLEYVQNK